MSVKLLPNFQLICIDADQTMVFCEDTEHGLGCVAKIEKGIGESTDLSLIKQNYDDHSNQNSNKLNYGSGPHRLIFQ